MKNMAVYVTGDVPLAIGSTATISTTSGKALSVTDAVNNCKVLMEELKATLK